MPSSINVNKLGLLFIFRFFEFLLHLLTSYDSIPCYFLRFEIFLSVLFSENPVIKTYWKSCLIFNVNNDVVTVATLLLSPRLMIKLMLSSDDNTCVIP